MYVVFMCVGVNVFTYMCMDTGSRETLHQPPHAEGPTTHHC